MASCSISDDIRKNVQNGLSLECDAKLLQYMEMISNKLINRAKTTSNNIDALSSELQRTSISLDNVTNRLSSLSHTKFVENRVYEDDETIANIKEVPVEIKAKEYNPIKTLNTVIKNNMKMLDNCYEKVSVELDDSDEEDEQIKSIVYRPKNKFEARPIPHLIGSKEWKEKWHIGIYDSDESFSENDNEEFSEGSDSVSLVSNGPTISESGSSVWSINRNSNFNNIPNKRNDYTSSDEEISTTSKTSSNDTKQQRMIKNIPQILPVHEQRYYVHQSKGKGLFDESSESENENRKSPVKDNKNVNNNIPEPLPRKHRKEQILESNKISNIFNDEPPEEEEEVVEQKNNKIPSKLFVDSDEGKMTNQNGRYSTQISTSQSDNALKKTVNLFDDDDFNSFMKGLDQKTNEKLIKVDRNINLFDDPNEDEIEVNTKHFPQVAVKKSDLFDEKLERKIIGNEKVPEIIEKDNRLVNKNVEVNDNRISTHKNIVETLSESKSIQNSLPTCLFEDEEDLFSSRIKPITKTIEKSIFENGISKTKIANLFDDTPPDDEFDNLFKTSSRTIKNVSNSDINANLCRPFLSADKSLNIPPIAKILNTNIFNELCDDRDEIICKQETDNLKNSSQKNENKVQLLYEESSKYKSSGSEYQNSTKINIQQTLSDQEIKNIRSAKKNVVGDVREDENVNIFKNNYDTIKKRNESENTEEPIKYESILINRNPVSINDYDALENEDNVFKSLVNTQRNNNITEQSTKIIEKEKEILGSKMQVAQNKTNFELAANDKENINKLLDDQKAIKSVTNYKLLNIFADEPPLDDFENLLPQSAADAISNEISNNEVSIENSTRNTDILSKTNKEKNIDKLTNIETNDLQNKELNLSSLRKTNGDNENILIKKEEANEEIISNKIDETTKINEFSKQTLFIPKQTLFIPTIFDDTPPDDNDNIFSSPTKNNLQETDIFDTSADNFNFKIQKVPSISSYDSVVFQDTVPPDDSNDNNTSKFSPNNDERAKSSIKSIIFDNTFTDIVSANLETQFKTDFIFDNEPPTDSFSDGNVDSKKSDLVAEKSLTVSDLIKNASTVSRDSDTGISNCKQILGSRKLSTNLNINVAALIPGAKRPIISSNNKDESDGSFIAKIQASNFEEESKTDLIGKNTGKEDSNYTGVQQASMEQSEQNILINLNKNRAKIPQRRRPPTKQGRLESYRKSLCNNEIEKNVEEVDHKSNNMRYESETKTIEKNEQEVTKNISVEISYEENCLTKSLNTQRISTDQNKLGLNHSNNQSGVQSVKNESINQSNVQSTKKNAFSIGNDSDDEDWLFNATNTTEQKIISNSKIWPLNNKVNELPNNLDNIAHTSKSNHETDIFSTQTNNNDWLCKETSKSNSVEKNNNFSSDRNSQAENVQDPLFYDKVDYEDNYLFSGNSAKTITKHEVSEKEELKKYIEPNEISNIESEDQIFKKIKIYKKKQITEEPISIPEESFQKSIKPIDKFKSKSIGLFDSDDDDLFGSSNANKKLIIKNNTPAIKTNKKFLNVPKRGNLFDDIDDDDDDLFGTKTTKAQSAVTKKIIEKPKINQSQGESTGYNPLADLLNEK